MAGSSGLPQCGFCPPWAGCQGVRDGASCMWGWPLCQLGKLGVHMPKNLVTGVRVRQQIAAAPVVPPGENFHIGTKKRWRDAFITSGTSPATPGDPQLAFQRGTCLWVQLGVAVAEVERYVSVCSDGQSGAHGDVTVCLNSCNYCSWYAKLFVMVLLAGGLRLHSGHLNTAAGDCPVTDFRRAADRAHPVPADRSLGVRCTVGNHAVAYNLEARVRAQLAAPTPLQRPHGWRWCRTVARWHPVRSPATKSPCSPG